MIRLLTERDFAQWKHIRLEALQKHPEAFGASYEEDLRRSDEEWMKRLKTSHAFAYFEGDKIIGVIGYFQHDGKKTHRAEIFTTYLKKEARGKGIMAALITALCEHAREIGIEQLALDVNVELVSAKKCYERSGFRVFATKPRTLKLDGRYIDTYMMIKYL